MGHPTNRNAEDAIFAFAGQRHLQVNLKQPPTGKGGVGQMFVLIRGNVSGGRMGVHLVVNDELEPECVRAHSNTSVLMHVEMDNCVCVFTCVCVRLRVRVRLSGHALL